MHQVCLVSEQLVPNVLPVLDGGYAIDTVTLVVTPKMARQASVLRDEFTRRNVRVLPDFELKEDVADLQALKSTFLAWIEEHEDDKALALNVTGGTKPMAIAAQEAFRLAGKQVFYVDAGTDRLISIDKVSPSRHLNELADLTTLLRLSMFKLKGVMLADEEPLSRELVEEKRRWAGFARALVDRDGLDQEIATLNYAATQAGEETKKAGNARPGGATGSELDAERFLTGRPPRWGEVMGLLFDSGLIASRDRLVFVRPEAREFARGVWLEFLVGESLRRLGFSGRYARTNVKLWQDGIVPPEGRGGPRNELDAVVAGHNRLYVIECKARNMRDPQIAAAAIYKLAQLTSISGGARGQGVLVTYRALKPADRALAEFFGIRLIEGIHGLDEDLRNVLKPGGRMR